MQLSIRLLAPLLAACAFSAEASKCSLIQIGELRIRAGYDLPIVDGQVNGKDIGVLLDTGATSSFVYRNAAERLGLVLRPARGLSFYGVGGEAPVFEADVGEVRIGSASRRNWRMYVVGADHAAPFDFVLGDDFFERAELELDLSQDMVRLFRAEGCEGAPLAYWSRQFHEVPIEAGDHIHLSVKVNGQAMRTMLDTGSSRSLLTVQAAARAGVKPESPGVAQGGCAGGMGAKVVTEWIGPFDTVAIGNQAIRDARLRFADLWRHAGHAGPGRTGQTPVGPDMILGMDFLRTHRVLVSRTQRKMYFTYAGGLVFPSVTATGCEAWEPSGDATNVNSLLLRARDLARQKEIVRALAELDEAVRRSPDNALAYLQRADARMATREYDLAMADYDAAIRHGARGARAHVGRGNAWRMKGDAARAAQEYGVALELDPRSASAFAARGDLQAADRQYMKAFADYESAARVSPRDPVGYWGLAHLEFRLRRFEDAARDFTRVMDLKADGRAAAWRYLARARGAEEGARADLRKDASVLRDAAWPMPLVLFHLGDIDRPALLTAAAQGDIVARRESECEATFHIGQSRLLEGDRAEARALLQRAVETCPPDFVEFLAARSDLARLY